MPVNKHVFLNRNPIVYLFGILVVVLVYIFVARFIVTDINAVNLVQTVEKQLNKIRKSTLNVSTTAGEIVSRNKKKISWDQFDSAFKNVAQTVVVRHAGTVLYWNHSDIPAVSAAEVNNEQPVVKLFPAGWFMVYRHEYANYRITIFTRLQNKYTIHNDFLADGNTDLFSLPVGVRFTTHKTGNNIYRIPTYNLAIKIAKPGIGELGTIVLLLLFFFGYLLLLLFLWSACVWFDSKTDEKYRILLRFLFLVGIIFLRVIDYSLALPVFVKQLPFFNEESFGIQVFNSWGDLVLNALLLIVILAVFINLIKEHSFSKKYRFVGSGLTIIVLIIGSFLLYALGDSILINNDVKEMIQNSIFNTNFTIDLFVIFMVNAFVYVLVRSLVDWMKRSGLSFAYFAFAFVIEVLVLCLVFHPKLEFVILVASLLLSLSVVVWFLSYRTSPYFYAVVILFLLSMAGAFLFNHTRLETRNAHQRLTAALLSQKSDPYFEFRFNRFANDIENDTLLRHIVMEQSPLREQKLYIYLNRHYFKNYFGRYSKQITLCEPGQQLEIQPNKQIIGCDYYFSQLGAQRVIASPKFSLSLVNNTQESLYYVAKFIFPQQSDLNKTVNLYIEFFADFLPKGLGYPELLVDARQNNLHLSGYSFARYIKGMLQYKFGDYLYPVDFSYFEGHKPDHFFFKDAYRHLIYMRSNDDLLIISRPKSTISQWLLPFSLLFLLSGLLVILFISLFYGRALRKLFRFSLRARLQLVFFGSVLSIFVLLSVVTLYYFNEANHRRIESELKEKAHSVLIELQNKLRNRESITDYSHKLLESYLQNFSMVFFSDINLYDTSGRLIASSRPEIFEKSLQSKWINPKAYYRIQLKHQLFYLSREQIGKLKFYSSYMPLTLDNGREAGMLNLPFFARQGEIQHSYYQMLANLINLFVITGILGFVFMVLLSKILTKPLRILQSKINTVRIDRKNEIIAWEDNDEIGQLIDAYNQMVKKLEHSAELLKMSEREKAWREMARQIAHEIRNPLTPMKLNVQYLEKAFRQGDENFGDKIKTISQSLISQIDTLNDVAGMFSDFSKTGLQHNQNTDLISALHSSIALFKKSYKVEFLLDIPDKKQIWVKASEQDLLRIFTNLIKNAIQAMEDQKNKRVSIKIYPKADAWWMEVIDFGKGIDPQYRTRIFQPYFTTKSTGTGLGLAIVKNMMKELGGEVDFETEQGKGTRFILKFCTAKTSE